MQQPLIQEFKDFEAAMSEVKAISGATGDEFAALTEKAMQMGADTKFSAVESAEAFKYMAMAGWAPQQMMAGISGIMSLAAASGESLGTTSDIVTDALTAFGLSAGDAGHFSDVLAQASASANTNVGLLGESFKYVAPVAGTMGYSIEDTSLALGLMANAGIKGSMAGTALKTSIANLASPTKEMASAMEQYGISLTDGEGNMLGLKGVMDNLRTSLGGLSETEQTAAASTIFGKEAMSGMLSIVNASEADYNKLTDAVYNADGAAQKMSETMMDNLAGSFEYLGGAVDEVQNTLGERLSPYLRGAADEFAESMPGVKSKIEEAMDWIDNRVSGMTASQEWTNAGFLGKINIAWDTLITEPFMDWVGGPGKHMITTGISSLFSEAGKIFTGNGGLTSWMSAGIIAKGALSTASGISKLISSLGGFSSIGGKIGLAGSAIAAGIGAVTVAIDNYNEQQINDSLEKQFGNIELSARQISDFTDQFFNAKFGANIDLVLEDIRGVREAKLEAENVLKANSASIATPHTGYVPHAEGGLFGNPHLGLVAEDGPEAIIPLGSKRRDRGLDLWMQAGEALGVKAYADGGMVGNIPVNTSTSGKTLGESININLTLNNSFSIGEDTDDNKIDALKNRLSKLVDDFSSELAERIRDAYSNTPIMV